MNQPRHVKGQSTKAKAKSYFNNDGSIEFNVKVNKYSPRVSGDQSLLKIPNIQKNYIKSR